MPEEIDLQNLKEKYPDFFKEIPPELLEFILSEATSSKIARICLENGIKEDEKIEKAAYQITLILLGVASEGGLTAALKKELGIDLITANKISNEVNNLIFSQILLEETGEPTLEGKTIEEAVIKNPPPTKNDSYKEPLE